MITTPNSFVFYVGNGNISEYSYAFNGSTGFETKVVSEVRAALLHTDGTRDTNPNFAVMTDTYGNMLGKVKFANNIPNGTLIFLYRNTLETQDISFETASGFSAKDVEKALDKLTKQTQELDTYMRRQTIQVDMFQQDVFYLILLMGDSDKKLLFVDWENKRITITGFTTDEVQEVIDTAVRSGSKTVKFLERDGNSVHVKFSDDSQIFMPLSENITHLRQFVDANGYRYIEYSVDGGITYTRVPAYRTFPNRFLDRISVNEEVTSTVTLNSEYRDRADYVWNEETPLPVAQAALSDGTSGRAGVMNASQAKALEDLAAEQAIVNSRAYSAVGIPNNPTQEQLSAAWESASGLILANLVTGVRVSLFDIDHQLEHIYYTDSRVWYSSTTPATVGYFTNNSGGIIHGSVADGQIFAEANGMGSVNGWDNVVAKSADALALAQEAQSEATIKAPMYSSPIPITVEGQDGMVYHYINVPTTSGGGLLSITCSLTSEAQWGPNIKVDAQIYGNTVATWELEAHHPFAVGGEYGHKTTSTIIIPVKDGEEITLVGPLTVGSGTASAQFSATLFPWKVAE